METLDRVRSPFDWVSGSLLIASLPQNTVEYAIQAQESGASAVMVGIDKTELAFPGLFAGLENQEQSIRDILSSLSIPVGVSIGEARPLTQEEWEMVVSMPFRFVNMFAHEMPLFVLEDDRMEKFVSIGPGYMLEQVRTIAEMDNRVVALEAAIVSSQARLYPFGLLDLSTITLISKLTTKPVFLRTQKKIGPRDIPLILKTGVRGITLDPSILDPGIEEYRDGIRGFAQWGAHPESEIR